MILPVYNYLLTNYMPKPQAANRSHKPSELRTVYSNMVKLNQKSPLYKINMTTDTQLFALSLKEAAMELSQSMPELNNAFQYVKAASDNPNAADAHILENADGTNTEFSAIGDTLPEGFTLQVHSLATTQVNTGSFVPAVNMTKAPREGNYSFTIEQEDSIYEFQFSIKENSKNEDILGKLSEFINKSKMGVKATILSGMDNTIALRLESEETGNTGEPIFTVKDSKMPDGQPGLTAFYDLNHITFAAENASYSIDGEEYSGLTNQFTLNRSLQVDLKAVSEEPILIGYSPDTDKTISQLKHFADSFNYTLQLARNFGAKQPTANRVIAELKGVLRSYLPELEAAGVSFDENGELKIDPALATDAIEQGEMASLFSKEDGPINDLIKKTNYIAINPMNYVDKTLVTYPNPMKPPIGRSYTSSMYSGLLFNYYC